MIKVASNIKLHAKSSSSFNKGRTLKTYLLPETKTEKFHSEVLRIKTFSYRFFMKNTTFELPGYSHVLSLLEIFAGFQELYRTFQENSCNTIVSKLHDLIP